jgi:hypothetical protein
MSTLSDEFHHESDYAATPIGRSVIFVVAIKVVGLDLIKLLLAFCGREYP